MNALKNSQAGNRIFTGNRKVDDREIKFESAYLDVVLHEGVVSVYTLFGHLRLNTGGVVRVNFISANARHCGHQLTGILA